MLASYIQDNRLFLDGSMLKTYMQCPRKFYFQYILLRAPRPGAALSFGSAVHKALETFYTKVANGDSPSVAIPPALEAGEKELSEVCQMDERRNSDALERLIVLYGNDPNLVKQPIILLNKDGSKTPAVELPFAINLKEGITWCGKIDLIAQTSEGRLVHVDFKTSSVNSQDFWNSWKSDVSQTGYAHALANALEVPLPEYFLIQALFTYTENSKLERLAQQLTPLCAGWEENIYLWVALLADENIYSIKRQNREACITKYGRCPYFETCQLHSLKAAERSLTNELQFQDNEWTPLNRLKGKED